jgi:hypothetical protein
MVNRLKITFVLQRGSSLASRVHKTKNRCEGRIRFNVGMHNSLRIILNDGSLTAQVHRAYLHAETAAA